MEPRQQAIRDLQHQARAPGQHLLDHARVQAKISHENICKIYEFGGASGKLYIAMQLIEGKDLKSAAAEMTVEQKARALQQIAQALQLAHEHHLVHGNIKASNIFLERSSAGGWNPYLL